MTLKYRLSSNSESAGQRSKVKGHSSLYANWFPHDNLKFIVLYGLLITLSGGIRVKLVKNFKLVMFPSEVLAEE